MNLFFCSCLPRSGSTLLLNLLGQNPAIHVTPTNALAELFVGIKDTWRSKKEFQAQGLKKVQPRILSAMKGLLNGFYSNERTVIDKSRTWIGYIGILEEVLEKKVKIIVPVREIEEIIASFEKIHRKTGIMEDVYQGPLEALRQSVVGRAQSHLAQEATLGMTITRLRNALDTGFEDRLLMVPYRYFTNYPKETVNWLTTELGLPKFKYDPNNVKQLTHEDDTVYGMELHTIREGKVEPQTRLSWPGILKDEFVAWIEKEYQDINYLANKKPPFLKGEK